MSGYGAAGTEAAFDSGISGPSRSSKQYSTAGSQISPQERSQIQSLGRTVSSNSSDFHCQHSRPLSRVSSASSLRSNSLGRRRRPGNHLDHPQYPASRASRSESNLIVPVDSRTEPEEFSDTESLDGRRVRTKYTSRPGGPRNNSWGGTLAMGGLIDDDSTESRDIEARQMQSGTAIARPNTESMTRNTQLLRAQSSVESIKRRFIEAHGTTMRNPNGEGSSDPLRNASRPVPPRKNSDWEPAMARSRDNNVAASRNSAVPPSSEPQMSFEAFIRESNNQMGSSSSARHTAGLSPSPGRIRAHSNSSGIYAASSTSGTTNTSLPSHSTPASTQITTRRLHTDVVLPRWQPDAEVTFCPICRTQFSFFVRKHHCRKCGRVVCNSCSPHRITIPYQFIVQPPTETSSMSERPDRPTLDPARAGSNFTSLGGGERVRLCNPCVPDPNIAPPQTPSFDGQRRPSQHSSHSRSSSLATPYYTLHQQSPGSQGLVGANFVRRSREQNIAGHGAGSTLQPPQQSTSLGSDEYLSASGAAGARSRSSTNSGQYSGPQRYIRPGVPQLRSPYTHSSTSRDDSQQSRERPLPHPPRLAEEDECPICHRELPSSALPNSEGLRAAHINNCIENAFGGSSASPRPPPVPLSNPPPAQASSSAAPPVPIANTPEARAAAREQAHAAVVLGHSASPGPIRRTRIFPYKATEKDCIDKAECTICLEEYEVNDDMGRLECLCRYHLKCINQWFERNHGQCPVHPYDGGY